MTEYKTITSNRFIVLDRYDKDSNLCESYQSEDALERELIPDLLNIGYTFDGLNSPEKLLANARVQSQTLNNVHFTDSEWSRFVETYLDRPSDNFACAQTELEREAEALIQTEGLNEEAAKRYLVTSLKREYASDNGTELNGVLPKMGPLNPNYLTKKQTVFQKIAAFVEKFKGVGGEI